jgi:ribosomal protein S18 acetylase RimI-like enzyme
LNIVIRDAAPSDAPLIAAFNTRMAAETENRSLDPGLVGPGVAAVLDDPGKGRYWLAEIDGEIAGQLMVSLEWSDWRNAGFWWIQSVYVPEQFRRSGVFSALYKHVESLAAARADVCGIRLYVEKDNTGAQQTYRKLGMTETGYRVMESLLAQD